MSTQTVFPNPVQSFSHNSNPSTSYNPNPSTPYNPNPSTSTYNSNPSTSTYNSNPVHSITSSASSQSSLFSPNTNPPSFHPSSLPSSLHQTPINSPMVISCRCGLPAVLREVRQGKNVGRRFYCCSKPRDQQCNFFVWADDPQASNPQPNPTLFASPPANTTNRGNSPGLGGYSNSVREKSEVTCFKCGKLGHLAPNCPNATKRKRKATTTKAPARKRTRERKKTEKSGKQAGRAGKVRILGRNEEQGKSNDFVMDYTVDYGDEDADDMNYVYWES